MARLNIRVNGKSISVEGNNVSIINDTVMVDGKVIKRSASGVVKVVVQGTINELRTDASVECGDVAGSVEAGGSVNCKNVGKDVDAGGSVNSMKVGGDIDAGGSVVIR